MSDIFIWILKSGVNLDEGWSERPTERKPQFWLSQWLTISDGMSTSPKDLLVISRPGLCRRQFATKQTEQRIRQNTEDRDARINSRYFRRNNLEHKPHIDTYWIEEDGEHWKIKRFYFLWASTTWKRFKTSLPNTGAEIRERLKRTLSKARQEAVQALWALI